MRVLRYEDLRELFRLATSLALERAALLFGLSPQLTSSIPLAGSPATQILADLQSLNEVDGNGDLPLVIWLQNAVALTEARSQDGRFRELLTRCGWDEGGAGDLLERLPGRWVVQLQRGGQLRTAELRVSASGTFSVRPPSPLLSNGVWSVERGNRLCLREAIDGERSYRIELTVRVLSRRALEAWSDSGLQTKWERLPSWDESEQDDLTSRQGMS